MQIKRDYSFDNAKLILIILVVFAHFLEFAKGYGSNTDIYRIIYSFHMPAMVFISGFFAKFTKRRIINIFVLYLLFQTLYIFFYNQIFSYETKYQYTTPTWLLWYLLAYLFYLFLVPIIDLKKYNTKSSYIIAGIVVLISFSLYFLMPFDSTQGYYLSISRFISFLPYFILGFYINKFISNNNFKIEKISIKLIIKLSFLVLTILSVLIIIFNKNITANMLYGSYAYKSLKYNPFIKLILLFCGLSWIGFLLYTIRFNKKIPVVTRIGENTLSIFILHGFILKWFQSAKYFSNTKINIFLIFLISIGIVYALGNVLMGYFSKYILNGKIIDVIVMKIKNKPQKEAEEITDDNIKEENIN